MTKVKEVVWTYNNKKVTSVANMPEGVLGIIYKITNLTNDKYYYGRKTVVSLRKKKMTKKEKLLPENKRKTVKRTYVEVSGWKKYTGSSKPLLEDIAKGDKYKKEIIKYCFSKAEITYYETEAIICSQCLLTEDCYNGWISAKVYKSHLLTKKEE